MEEPAMDAGEIRDRVARAVDQLGTRLWDAALGSPLIALDRAGPISGVSSDALQMLAYLSPGDLADGHLASMVQAARALETPYGYRTYAPGQKDFDPHAYHLGAIWPFEQAMIACGARRHGVAEVGDVALRVVDGLEIVGFAELYYWSEEAGLEGALAVAGQGCDLQLWTLCVPTALLALTGTKVE
jgi:glycogen debranching enzyme